MALPVKHRDSFVPDVREVKDGSCKLTFLAVFIFAYIYSVVERAEEELLGSIRGRCHVPRSHPGTMAFSGSR